MLSVLLFLLCLLQLGDEKRMKVKMTRSNEDAVSPILKCDVCVLAAQQMLPKFCSTFFPSVGAGVQKLRVVILKDRHLPVASVRLAS